MENADILKELLDTGVLTQEEYDAKMKQLVPEEEETSPQKETAGLSELETLIHLKNEKVITQDEYAQKAAHILGIATFPKESSKKIAASGSWLKNNIVSVIIIAVLLAASIFMGTKVSSVQTENTDLKADLDSAQQRYENMQSSYYKAKKAQTVLIDEYLDEAVVIRTGDDKYYHRLNCPTFPNSYRYRFLIPEAAEGEGYSKCLKCFGIDAQTYIKDNF